MVQKIKKLIFNVINCRKGKNEEWKRWLKEIEEKENQEKIKKQEIK